MGMLHKEPVVASFVLRVLSLFCRQKSWGEFQQDIHQLSRYIFNVRMHQNVHTG